MQDQGSVSQAAPKKNRPLKPLLNNSFGLFVSNLHSLIWLPVFWWPWLLKLWVIFFFSWMISFLLTLKYSSCGHSRSLGCKESACNAGARSSNFDPWVGKILWRRAWQSTLVFLPRKFHRQRSLVACSPWGPKEWDRTEWLNNNNDISSRWWCCLVTKSFLTLCCCRCCC